MAFSRVTDLKKYIKNHKDIIDTFSKNNVVYHIPCKNCESTYIGQTKRPLKVRLKEHQADIKKDNNLFVISRHIIDYNHDIDWDNTKILDNDR